MTRRRWATALTAVGVVALSVAVWRRLLSTPGDPLPVVLGAVLVIVVVVGVIARAARRDDVARRAAAADRPGWSTWAVWSDAALGVELRRQGWHVERLRPGGGSRLTLAWSAAGVELWRGGDVLVELPWDDVAAVTVATGNAAGAVRAAVCLSGSGDSRLVLVPAARPTGGLAPAGPRVVAGLVARLRAVRDLARG